MNRVFTRKSEKEKRRFLRKNMTKAEVHHWIQLKNKQIEGKRFLRQFSIKKFVVDFYCPEAKLAIEIDGATHISKEEIEYDKNRQKEIEDLGIRFLRFDNMQIYGDIELVISQIRETLNN